MLSQLVIKKMFHIQSKEMKHFVLHKGFIICLFFSIGFGIPSEVNDGFWREQKVKSKEKSVKIMA